MRSHAALTSVNEHGTGFDLFQFAGKRKNQRAVSSDSCISFEDFQRMHVKRSPSKAFRCRKFIPPWANNDKQIRTVIMHRGWLYVHGGSPSPMPSDMTLETLAALCDEKFKRDWKDERGTKGSKQWAQWDRFKFVVARAGGYLALTAAILYRSYRLGQTSPQIAEQMGLSPVAVRQQINRMSNIAQRLGLECAPLRKHAMPLPQRRTAKRAYNLAKTHQRRKFINKMERIALPCGGYILRRQLLPANRKRLTLSPWHTTATEYRRAKRYGVAMGEWRTVWSQMYKHA